MMTKLTREELTEVLAKIDDLLDYLDGLDEDILTNLSLTYDHIFVARELAQKQEVEISRCELEDNFNLDSDLN